MGISEDELAIPSEEELTQSQRNFLPTESIIEAEKRAMDIVMKLERKKLIEKYGLESEGELWNVENVSLFSHYDIKVEDIEDGTRKFIEVKGHLPFILSAELTTKEVEFANNHPEEYWVYIVANMKKRPLILKIYRPFLEDYQVYLVTLDENLNPIEETDITDKVEVKTIVKARSLIQVKFKQML